MKVEPTPHTICAASTKIKLEIEPSKISPNPVKTAPITIDSLRLYTSATIPVGISNMKHAVSKVVPTSIS